MPPGLPSPGRLTARNYQLNAGGARRRLGDRGDGPSGSGSSRDRGCELYRTHAAAYRLHERRSVFDRNDSEVEGEAVSGRQRGE